MERIKNKILECMYNLSNDPDRLISELDRLIKLEGDKVYPVIFQVMAHLEIDAEEARHYWEEILKHRAEINNSLRRNVNLVTVISDYFYIKGKCLDNPIILDIHTLEDVMTSIKFDALTKLYTRGYMESLLEHELSRAKRYSRELSILFLDLDDFKRVNDSFGHIAGDLALKSVADIVLSAIRHEDMATRYGGEEIVIILPETKKVRAFVLGERIREMVEDMNIRFEDMIINLTISGGLASFPGDADDVRGLLQCADRAMYRAKESGKNNIVAYSEDKRLYIRVDFSDDINIQEIGYDKGINTFQTMGKNISQGGILFVCDHPLQIGTKVRLTLPRYIIGSPLILTGTVVRVEIFDVSHYDIGISFVEMDKGMNDNIAKYIRRILETKH